MDTNRGSAGREQWGPVARAAMAAGVFVSVVSLCLFIHTISQLASPLVSAGFIAGGIVARRRATTPRANTIAFATLAGGVIGAVASLVLAAAGR